MNVASILKKKGRNVETASLDTSLVDVSRTMIEKGIGSVVILNREGKVAGVISERDIVRLVARDGEVALSEPVENCLKCLNRIVPLCRESDSLITLENEMTEQRARHIPVIEGGRLVGLVSIGDVVKARIAASEMEAAAMRSYIATG